MAFRDEVYKLVKKIPRGKVTTYGQIAIILRYEPDRQTRFVKLSQTGFGTGIGARAVGSALHQNKDLDIPCHRVVDRNGRLAPNYAFDGAEEQRRRLLTEGVKFRDNMHVNLMECLWQKR